MNLAHSHKQRFTCIEEEMVEKLNIMSVMFDHFGWERARDYIDAARDEILRMPKNVSED